MRRLISVLAVGMLMVLCIVMARAQGPAGPVFAGKMLVNNQRVQIQRLSVPSGFKETLQVVANDQRTPHQFLNVGKTPYDVVVVMLK